MYRVHTGLVGGNPTMNTPRLYLVFLYSIFCCDSASEFGAMGSTSFLGFSCPNLLLVFLNLLFLGTCIICFSLVLGLGYSL